jgi:hypothetical protein
MIDKNVLEFNLMFIALLYKQKNIRLQQKWSFSFENVMQINFRKTKSNKSCFINKIEYILVNTSCIMKIKDTYLE